MVDTRFLVPPLNLFIWDVALQGQKHIYLQPPHLQNMFLPFVQDVLVGRIHSAGKRQGLHKQETILQT